MNLQEINNELNRAVAVNFYDANLPNRLPHATLIFSNQFEGLDAYNELLLLKDSMEKKLYITPNASSTIITINIRDIKSKPIIIIKDIPIDKNSFREYLKTKSISNPIVFVVGFYFGEKLVFTFNKPNFSPLFFNGMTIV